LSPGIWARKFTLEGDTVYWLLNFDRQRGAFVRLRLDVSAEGTWALHAPVFGRHFTSGPGPASADTDLRDGVPLHIGAARARFVQLSGLDATADYGWRIDCRAIAAAAAAG